MSTDNHAEILNMRRFEESTGGDRELMSELAALYLVDSDARVSGLHQAVERRELQRMGEVAHGLKGSSAALGCDEAAEAFRVLEDMGRDGVEEGVDAAFEAAQTAWRRACEKLRPLAA